MLLAAMNESSSPSIFSPILDMIHCFRFSSVQSLSCIRLFATPWTAARKASLFITNSWSSLRLRSIESVMPSSHLILCRPFSSCPQSLPASESFPMSQLFAWGWPKYWNFSFSIIPSKEHPCTHADIQIAEMYNFVYFTSFFRTRD